MKSIWKGEGFPKDWRKAVIFPIRKNGDKDKAANYRGISLLESASKLYAAILNERIRKDVEEKNILAETQQVLGRTEEQ